MHLRRQRKMLWSLSMILVLGIMGCGQVSERGLKRDVEILKKNQEELRKELEELKTLIRGARPTTSNIRDVEFELGDNLVQGDSAALLTLVEFTDYE